MTTPVQHGFPDWGRQAASSDIRVFEIASTVQNQLSVVQGTFFVGNLPYLTMSQSVNAGGMRTTLQFRDAPVGGNLIASNAIDTRLNMSCVGPVAVQGPYVEIITTVDAIGRTITLRVWQGYSWGMDYRANQHNAIFTIDGTNVNGGVTRTDDAPNVRWGWGYISQRLEDVAVGRFRLLTLDYTGATQFVLINTNQNNPLNNLFLLPPRPLQAVVFNGDAGAHPYYLSVYHHSGPF